MMVWTRNPNPNRGPYKRALTSCFLWIVFAAVDLFERITSLPSPRRLLEICKMRFALLLTALLALFVSAEVRSATVGQRVGAFTPDSGYLMHTALLPLSGGDEDALVAPKWTEEIFACQRILLPPERRSQRGAFLHLFGETLRRSPCMALLGAQIGGIPLRGPWVL